MMKSTDNNFSGPGAEKEFWLFYWRLYSVLLLFRISAVLT